MKVAFKNSFAKDLKKVGNKETLKRVKATIEAVENADRLTEVENIKKLQGGGSFYRIRIGDYRVALIVEGDTVTFVRFLHRREIYRFFP